MRLAWPALNESHSIERGVEPRLRRFSCAGHMHRSMKKLFDHLVGAGDERRRHGEAEGFRGLEVDYQFELGRLFDG